MMISPDFTINDTLATTTKTSESGSDWILHHILDGNELELPFIGHIHLPHIELFGLDVSITRHVVFMWVTFAILVAVFYAVRKSYEKSKVPSGLTNVMEIIILFVKDEIVKPTIGKGYEKFLPFLLTIFFFILTSNFLGLVPYSATVTSNISITASLAIISFLVMQIGGILNNGFLGYFKGLVPHGVPIWLIPVMFVVELLGLFTKPFALAIRLFANMTGGHLVILSLIGLIFILKTVIIIPLSIAFALFIYLLEILVALIQAYIFTILSSLFIGMAVHQEH